MKIKFDPLPIVDEFLYCEIRDGIRESVAYEFQRNKFFVRFEAKRGDVQKLIAFNGYGSSRPKEMADRFRAAAHEALKAAFESALEKR